MSEWLKLKEVPVGQDAAVPDAPGLQFDLAVSPYDVPDAVRGFISKPGRFRLEFRYIDGDEPPGSQFPLTDHVTATEGRITRRLLSLEVDTRSLNVRSVGLSVSTLVEKLENAMKDIVARQPSLHHRHLASSARSAMSSRAGQLFSELAST